MTPPSQTSARAIRHTPRLVTEYVEPAKLGPDSALPDYAVLEDRIVRRWPTALPVVQGESFTSWFDRLSASAGVPLTTAAYAAGIIDIDSAKALPAGWGVWLSEERVQALAVVTGQAAEVVSATLLSSLGGRVVDLSTVRPEDPSTLTAAARREWLWFAGSPACGQCLARPYVTAPAGGVWPLWWRLPFMSVCPTHECLLLTSCPTCGGALGNRRTDGRALPSYPSLVPSPAHCVYPPKAGRGPGVPCGADLRNATGSKITDNDTLTHILTAQQHVVDVARGEIPVPTISAVPVEPLSWFKSLRSAWALTAYAANVKTVPNLAKLPPSTLEAVATMGIDREALTKQRSKLITKGVDYKKGSRTRLTVGMPRDTALVAALLPTALGLLSSPDSAEFIAATQSVATGIRLRERSTSMALSWYSVPEEAAKTIRRLGNGGKFFTIEQPEIELEQLKPYEIPQAFWLDQYTEHLVPIIGTRMNIDTGRLGASLTLARHVAGCTWPEAAAYLGLPSTYGLHRGNAFIGTIRTSDIDEQAMLAALATVAQNMSAPTKPRVDWSARRVQWSDWKLSQQDWKPLAASLNVHIGKGAKRRFVSSWIWSVLTGNLWHTSPEYAVDPSTATDREIFVRWWKREGHTLEPPLRQYAEQLT